jgi:retron-type reverse transcriptase
VHSLHKSKESDVIIKLDYEKTYDKVSIESLMKIIKGRGFGDVWCKWISMIITWGSVCVATNGEECGTFKTRKGLRQGGPLSPLLFNLVVDALNKMLVKASERGLISDLMRGFRLTGILSL